MPDLLSFNQVMGEVRGTGAQRLVIRVEVGSPDGLSQSCLVDVDPQGSNNGALAQLLLQRIKDAADAYQRKRDRTP